MPTSSQIYTGRSFLTTVDLSCWRDGGEPVWQPLEQLAKVVRQSSELPHFHHGEFMYMAAVVNKRLRVRIHLYKHIDTRRYLNLDDGGHAYAYLPKPDDPDSLDSGGRYRRYAAMDMAIIRLGLGAFRREGLYRSFPPEEWPADPW